MSSTASHHPRRTAAFALSFLPFWLFLIIDNLAMNIHYSVLSPLGGKLLPLALVGLLIGGQSIVQMFLDVPAGFLVDRFGRKRMLLFGLAGILIIGILFMHFSLTTFVASIVVSILGWLFINPGANAYLLAYANRSTSGRFLALRDMSHSTGVVLASAALPFILLYSPFAIGTVLVMLAALAAVFLMASPADKPVVHGTHTLPAEPYHVRRTDFKDSLRALKRLNPASGMLSFYSFCGAIFYGAIWFVVPLVIATDPHRQILGIGLAIFDLSVVVLGVFIGSLVDRGDKRLLVFYGLLVFAVMGIAVGSTFGPLFLLFGFLATAGDETAGLSLWSWLHSLDKAHAHDGAVAGAITFAEDFGYALGPILAGFAYATLGPAWTLTVAALPLVISWGVYTIVAHPKLITLKPATAAAPRMPRRRRHK